jgi:hypothetical protein
MKRKPNAAEFRTEIYLVADTVIANNYGSQDYRSDMVEASQVFSAIYELLTSERLARSFATDGEPTMYGIDLYALVHSVGFNCEGLRFTEEATRHTVGYLNITSHTVGMHSRLLSSATDETRDRKLEKWFRVEVRLDDEYRTHCIVTEV